MGFGGWAAPRMSGGGCGTLLLRTRRKADATGLGQGDKPLTTHPALEVVECLGTKVRLLEVVRLHV